MSVKLDMLGLSDKLAVKVLPALSGCQVHLVSPDHQVQVDSKDLPEPLETEASLARLDLMDGVDRSVLPALPVLQEMWAVQVSLADWVCQVSRDLPELRDYLVEVETLETLEVRDSQAYLEQMVPLDVLEQQEIKVLRDQ